MWLILWTGVMGTGFWVTASPFCWGLEGRAPWGVRSVLLARDSFVPILPGLGVSVLTFPGQRLGPADEGTRGPNGCWIAGTSLDILLPWRSCSGQCYVHLRS